MPRYRVATPSNKGLTTADKFDYPEAKTTEDCAVLMRPHGFDGCSVWKFDGRAKHWGLIFDTSLPDSGRLPPNMYWCNVAKNERS